MDIGLKLKNARLAAGFTQEHVAEKIGVSRQTISNWENNRSYPDIVSVIAFSDLYSISLDQLLKEDKNMIHYLEESTNTVKSRQTFAKLTLILSYLIIWAAVLIVFWLGGASGSNAMGYALAAFYLVLPVTTLIISIFIGKDDGWSNVKWLMLIFFGFMYMIAPYATFSLANMIAHDKFNAPAIAESLPGILSAAVGMSIGSIIKAVKNKKNRT